MTDGERLSAYIRARWPRGKGGIRRLISNLGTSPDTFYGYLNDKHPVDMEFLGRLAVQLSVRRYEIVAAMDGVGPIVPLDEQSRELVREEVRAALAEAGVQVPRGGRPARGRGATSGDR